MTHFLKNLSSHIHGRHHHHDLTHLAGAVLPKRFSKTVGVLLATGAALVGAAVFNKAKARQAESAVPPIGKCIVVDGVRLHYVERGEGKPVVMLHGNGAMIQDYKISGLLDKVAERYKVIVFDRPGFGYSGRPSSKKWTPTEQGDLFYKALGQMNLEQPLVVGHSWGTLVALAMALNHPNRLAGLVLMSGYYFPSARADVPLLSLPALPVVGKLLSYTVSPLMGRLFETSAIKKMFAPAPVPDRFSKWPSELALRPEQIEASATETALMVPAATALSKRYNELALPVTIVAGKGDKIVSFEKQSERLHGAIKHSELIGVDGVGHMVHYAVPDRIVEALDRIRDRTMTSIHLE
jgi:pimeloyl-ACP methyl ester carboxylesterase